MFCPLAAELNPLFVLISRQRVCICLLALNGHGFAVTLQTKLTSTFFPLWREKIFVHTWTHARLQLCWLAFRVVCVCHGKLGWKLNWLLGDIFAIYGTFFFLLSSHCCRQYLLCPWHLNAVRRKFLHNSVDPNMLYCYIRSFLKTHFFPSSFGFYQNLIFSSDTTWDILCHGTENKRKTKVSRQAKI